MVDEKVDCIMLGAREAVSCDLTHYRGGIASEVCRCKIWGCQGLSLRKLLAGWVCNTLKFGENTTSPLFSVTII